MHSCEQAKGQSVYQHGESVQNYLFDLLSHMREGTPLKYEWKLPEWISTSKYTILSSLPDDKTLKLYTQYHDIGKPYCKTIDNEGKIHFPNHAAVSAEVFRQVFDNELAAQLIAHDMDLHTLKSEQVPEWLKANESIALTLLIVSLSEIHSNAQMFGGIDSTSFKIKHKCITQRGKQIINLIINNSK